MLQRKQNDGLSLRTIHICLVIGAVIMAALMLYATVHLSTDFSHIAQASEQRIELRKAARELMDASDYLTESVQRFAVLGDRRFMDDYFTEAFENNRREDFYPGDHTRFNDWTGDRYFKRGSYTITNGESNSISVDLTGHYSHRWDKHMLLSNVA